MRGAWTLPGGALETGETMLEGVEREVLEETGLRVRPLELLALLDRIVRDESGAVEFHYVLMDWLCEVAAVAGAEPAEAHAGGDALDVAWMTAEEITGMEEIDEATRRVVMDALARAAVRA